MKYAIYNHFTTTYYVFYFNKKVEVYGSYNKLGFKLLDEIAVSNAIRKNRVCYDVKLKVRLMGLLF